MSAAASNQPYPTETRDTTPTTSTATKKTTFRTAQEWKPWALNILRTQALNNGMTRGQFETLRSKHERFVSDNYRAATRELEAANLKLSSRYAWLVWMIVYGLWHDLFEEDPWPTVRFREPAGRPKEYVGILLPPLVIPTEVTAEQTTSAESVGSITPLSAVASFPTTFHNKRTMKTEVESDTDMDTPARKKTRMEDGNASGDDLELQELLHNINRQARICRELRSERGTDLVRARYHLSQYLSHSVTAMENYENYQNAVPKHKTGWKCLSSICAGGYRWVGDLADDAKCAANHGTDGMFCVQIKGREVRLVLAEDKAE